MLIWGFFYLLSNMKKINAEHLFALFEADDEQVYEQHGYEDQLKNPYVIMGMVIKGIENFFILDKIYLKNDRKHYKEVRESIKFKYFNRLYEYLTRINYNTFEAKYTIAESYDIGSVLRHLDYMRRYYEGLEEYEKCAVIKKYIDLLYDKPNIKLDLEVSP